jgi:hypothetical protein
MNRSSGELYKRPAALYSACWQTARITDRVFRLGTENHVLTKNARSGLNLQRPLKGPLGDGTDGGSNSDLAPCGMGPREHAETGLDGTAKCMHKSNNMRPGIMPTSPEAQVPSLCQCSQPRTHDLFQNPSPEETWKPFKTQHPILSPNSSSLWTSDQHPGHTAVDQPR